MSIKQGSIDNILTATVYNTDGSVKTDLAHNTSGISIVVKRLGQSDSSAITLTAKAADNSTFSAGAFRNLGNGRISVDVADSFFSGFTGKIWLSGSYTGGTIVGDYEQVTGYDPTAVAVGANTIAPATPANVTDAKDSVLTILGTPEGASIAADIAAIDSSATTNITTNTTVIES